MKVRSFPLVVGAILTVFVGTLVVIRINQTPEPPRPGIEQTDHGREHVEGQEYGGDEPPTSGNHASPVAWGVYMTEIRDDQAIHNMEHGGIYVSYRPDLPKEQIEKLTSLLSAPFADPKFQPKKILLAPRQANTSPIELSSWRRSESLQSFDKEKIQDYISRNLGKSPEPLAS